MTDLVKEQEQNSTPSSTSSADIKSTVVYGPNSNHYKRMLEKEIGPDVTLLVNEGETYQEALERHKKVISQLSSSSIDEESGVLVTALAKRLTAYPGYHFKNLITEEEFKENCGDLDKITAFINSYNIRKNNINNETAALLLDGFVSYILRKPYFFMDIVSSVEALQQFAKPLPGHLRDKICVNYLWDHLADAGKVLQLFPDISLPPNLKSEIDKLNPSSVSLQPGLQPQSSSSSSIPSSSSSIPGSLSNPSPVSLPNTQQPDANKQGTNTNGEVKQKGKGLRTGLFPSPGVELLPLSTMSPPKNINDERIDHLQKIADSFKSEAKLSLFASKAEREKVKAISAAKIDLKGIIQNSWFMSKTGVDAFSQQLDQLYVTYPQVCLDESFCKTLQKLEETAKYLSRIQNDQQDAPGVLTKT